MPRLPFTGIDEISSTSGGSSDEGGGELPPYGEDLFQRIVDVNWAATGGVFVSGDFCCFQRYTRLESNKSADFAWLPLGSQAFGDGGGTHSSSFAVANGKPTFLLGGTRGNGSSLPVPSASYGVLMLSNDGYNWTEMQAGYVMGNNIRALVWDADEKLFYAATDDIRPYYSPDGIYWYYSASFIEEHYKGPIDAPDGVYGYDKKNDVVIYPDGGEAVAIINASTFDAEEFVIWTGLDLVNAVNYTGGVWMAGGAIYRDIRNSATVTSLDGGGFWFYSSIGDLGMAADYPVTTLIGAPIKHFRNDPSAPNVTPGATGTLRGANTPIRRKGPPHASQPQRPERGVMAAAISGPRRPGPLLRRAFRRV